MEKFANNISNTLNGAITNSATSIVLTSATGFPTTGNFRILIDTEILLCTARSSNTLTVVRGQEGTTAASHTSGTTVDHILTKGALDQYRSDNCLNTTYANVPATIAVEGRSDLLSDGYYWMHEDATTGWLALGPNYKLTPPQGLTGYNWINQGSATEDTSHGHLVLYTPANSGDSYRIRVKTAPATPCSLTGYFAFTNSGSGVWFGGFIARESSSGKFIALGVGYGGSGFASICVYKFNSPTSFNAVPVEKSIQDAMNFTSYGIWMKYRDDGTNRTFELSNDGVNFAKCYQETRTIFCTADQYGYGANRNNSSEDGYMTIYSYSEGA